MAPTLSKYQRIGIALALCAVQPSEKRKIWMKKRCELSRTNMTRTLEPVDLNNLLGMDKECFETLLKMVAPLIRKQDTIMRKAISPRERLTITLRFLATGQSYENLRLSATVSPQLMSRMIPETCAAIYRSLKRYIKMPATEAKWKDAAKMFEDKWNFSHCVGAIDGKHIAIEKPPGSGSSFYNYKSGFSVILFGVVNANYEFMYVHTGTKGSVSDGGVIEYTSLNNKLIGGDLNLPPSSSLPGTNILVPFTFLADNAFNINRHIMTPYPLKNINHEQRIFNYRLSRARRVAENTFGVLGERFGIFRQRISVNICNVDNIVLACCALHNYLRTKSSTYMTETSVDTENTDDITFHLGDWRDTASELVSLAQINERESNDEGIDLRNKLTTFFNGEGSVDFQEAMLRVVPSCLY